MVDITEREFVRLIDLWRDARVGRAGIAKSTRKGIFKRCLILASLLQTDDPLSELTVIKVLEAPGQYSYRHRLAKKLLWCAKWAFENHMIPDNPLKKVRIPKPKFDHRKVFLSANDIETLQTVTLSGHLEKTRDIFLLQCYTGLAYADVKRIDRSCYFKGADREFLRLCRAKTSNPILTILRREATEILDKWNWAVSVPSNQCYNKFLKELQEATGIEQNLFSHLGRKTFAQYYTERGISLQITAKMMGITDVRTITSHYATITDQAISSSLRAAGL